MKRKSIILRLTGLLIIAVMYIVSCKTYDAPNAGTNKNTDAPGDLKRVKLLIDWKAEPTYAGFYIAKEKGFYAKRGVDVEIVEGNGANTSAQIIGEGNSYFIGSCSGEATAIARSKGIPIRSLAVFYPNVPTVLYSRADTPIRRPEDMIGKRIGLITGSISVDEYRGLIAANNVDRSKIKEVDAGFDVAPLLSKQVDALMNYEELTPVELRLKGYDIVTMKFADFGIKAYSLNLIVNESKMQSEGDIVKAITDATIEGYQFLRSNPDESAQIFSKLYPEKDPNYVRDSMKVVAKLLGDGQIGQQTEQGWNNSINTLSSLGLLEKPVKVDDVIASQYLSK